MIAVDFTADVENIVATEHLYQWDNGQKLRISGVDTSADIHFANKKSEKALVVTPTVTLDVCVAPIPNSLLSEPYPILAYVYVPSDDGARTIKSVTIYVEARKQPSDFVLEDDEGITTLETISQRASEVLQNVTNQVNTAVNNMQTDYSNFKSTIQSELDDMKANTTIPNADTVDGMHASDFTLSYIMGSKPLITSVTPMQNSVKFTWFPVDNATKYSVGIWKGGKTYQFCSTSITNTTYTATGLESDTEYDFLIQAYVNGKWNVFNTSDHIHVVTQPKTMSFGTADAQVNDPSAEGYVKEGTIYGQYEADTTT